MSRPTWSQKTYEMVASALNAEYVKSGPDAQVGILNAACELAERFQQDNPQFSFERFYDRVTRR